MLTDRQMKQFIVDGYLVVKTDLPPEFHQEVFRKTEEVFEKEGNPGNNLLPRIPALQKVLEDPAVVDTLTGILGANYFMEPHRHNHYNPPGSAGQTLHKDSFTRRRHHTRYAMVMYYPQDTTVEMGPTALLPGSQYYNTLGNDSIEIGTPVAGEAGSVIIANYDIRHGGSPNRSQKHRHMMKFLATRMDEPQAPSWDSSGVSWSDAGDDGLFDAIPSDIVPRAQKMWEHLWTWHQGQSGNALGNGNGSADGVGELVSKLGHEKESIAFQAAYTLSDMGESAVPAVIDAMLDEDEAVRWHEVYQEHTKGEGFHSRSANASYALSAMGSAAVPALMEVAARREWWARVSAVEALGDIGLAAGDAVPVLAEAVADESELVRRHAVEGLGTAGQGSTSAVPALIDALGDDSENVRRNATLALARIGVHAQETAPALKSSLEDENRYVRGQAVHALYRIGTPEAKDTLIEHLMTSRWCHSSTPESRY
jgi:hypothetical protein